MRNFRHGATATAANIVKRGGADGNTRGIGTFGRGLGHGYLYKDCVGLADILPRSTKAFPAHKFQDKKKPANLRLRAESNLLKEENWRRQVQL
jgi:hypothetical protein